MMAPVLLVASNDTHVRMYAPVMDVLGRRGIDTVVIALDAYYLQGACDAANQLQVPISSLPRSRGPAKSPFYRRPIGEIWADTLSARDPVRELLARVDPQTVVFGNDHGLIEKLILREAKAHGSRTVLIQDGRLAPRPRATTARSSIGVAMKKLGSRILSMAHLSYLGSSDYGSGGADVMCASGASGADILRNRASEVSEVLITGQPRYDALSAGASPSRDWDLVMFTTPFESAGLGRTPQERQEQLASRIQAWSFEESRSFAVKPHPRERAASYRQVLGDAAVLDGPPGEILARCSVAIIGMSTLLEEAAIVDCPVIVPGLLIHQASFDDVLPPPDAYPRADTMEQLTKWINQLTEEPLRASVLARQRRHVERSVDRGSDTSASERIADVILSQ